ncbi:MAG: hypothetical protein NTV07_01855 [Candidatus Omnitrophica bacterium]|nr:hypothetical protein [Candidatus Omnitrophota bacterium]
MTKTKGIARYLTAVVLYTFAMIAPVFAAETKADVAKLFKAQPLKIIPIGDLKILGGWSDTDRGSPLWGFDIAGSFSPALRLSEKQHIIPLYSGEFKRMRQYITQEEGGRLYNTSQIHNASLAWRSQMTDEVALRMTGIGTWSFTKETKDEEWGKGLYDYEDYGAAVDLRYTDFFINEKGKFNYLAGFEFFHRRYPHYQSLISLAAQTAPETHEKDFDGYKLSAGVEEMKAWGINWSVKPYVLLKHYIDKKLIGDNGVLDISKKRKDLVFECDATAIKPLVENRWEIGVDAYLNYTESNLGYYDSMSTTTIADDVYTPKYYTYTAGQIYPYLTYYHPIGKDKNFVLRGGYSYMERKYTHRLAQESNRNYTNSKQKDREYGCHFMASYPIKKSLSWITTFDYVRDSSNQKFEQYYYYNYDVYEAMTGITWEF